MTSVHSNLEDFAFGDISLTSQQPTDVMFTAAGKTSHPALGELIWLVLQAVIEVVVVALPGYIVARRGNFDQNAQKFVANLNITLFTPCLIFSKLASQLEAQTLKDLVVIPVILLIQTIISWISAKIAGKLFRLRKQPQNNFVTAMAVFGNSNSVPLSLVISLSHTISGLHWDKIPNDNDNEVMARGILYLLIFSQLGQAVRWSWGMNTLLRPLDQYTPEERGEVRPLDEEGFEPYQDSPSNSRPGSSSGEASSSITANTNKNKLDGNLPAAAAVDGSGAGDVHGPPEEFEQSNGHSRGLDGQEEENGTSFKLTRVQSRFARSWENLRETTYRHSQNTSNAMRSGFLGQFEKLPEPLQKGLTGIAYGVKKVVLGVWGSLNIPLISIILSVVVACVPQLKDLFFHEHSPVYNSVTQAIKQMGNVAVPLILVVLGANLAKNTLPDQDNLTEEYKREERNMVIAALTCRMLLPTILMTPILALFAKYVPVSILDDPIFVIVCFLLAGAPSALQLAQMCQVNEVYVGAVSRILFHSYVVWILPSTLILVVLALEIVEWATV